MNASLHASCPFQCKIEIPAYVSATNNQHVFGLLKISKEKGSLQMKLLICIPLLSGLLLAEENVDLAVVNRIKAEAFQNSQAMEHVAYLTDVYGPRLTNSPGNRAAAEWAMKQLKSWGLVNVHLEKWGPFGTSWRLKHFAGHLLEPQYQPLIGMPLAWTPGTGGVVKGEPVMAVIAAESDFEKYKGKLRGKIVLLMETRALEAQFMPLGHRWTDEEIEARNTIPDVARMSSRPRPPAGAPEFRNKRNQFLKDEGALVVLQYGTPGDGGTIFVVAGGSRDAKDPVPPPTVALTPEHYNRIARLVTRKIPVKLEFEIDAEFLKEGEESYNIIAEIPGTSKKDEIVMLGGHFDSWHGGTGATDNAAGSSVAMEAVRILTKLKLPMDRTVRIALWNGEEQGLLGSKAYVQEHFANRESMMEGSEYKKLSVYFNTDNGTGKYRGINAGGNDMVKPIFKAWLEPFHDLEAKAVIGTTALPTRQPGGTDHTSFTWIGLPGFGFLQDSIEYATRTHHSNMDVYDRIQAGDMMQMSAIMASFVYNSATRPEMIPRMPKPAPQKQER